MQQPIVRRTITPDILQVIVCVALASTVILISLRQWIINHLARSVSLEPSAFTPPFNHYSQVATMFAHSTIGKLVFVLLFLVGLIMFGYGMRTLSKTGGRGQLLYPGHRLKARLLQFLTILLLMVLTFATIRYTQPLWLSIINQAVAAPFGPVTVIGGLVAVIGSTINYYALLVFAKLAFVV